MRQGRKIKVIKDKYFQEILEKEMGFGKPFKTAYAIAADMQRRKLMKVNNNV